MKSTVILFMVGLFAVHSASAQVVTSAAELCIEKAGIHQDVRTRDSTLGICAFDRGLIEEETLKTELSGTRTIAIQKLLKGARKGNLFPGNPASVYCERRLKGESVIVDQADGSQFSVCQFKDGSALEEWTLFRGIKAVENASLLKVLSL